MSKLFLAILFATLLVHLGKFVDWALGPLQHRLKDEALTELYAFLEMDQLKQFFALSMRFAADFFGWFFDDKVYSARWFGRAAIYSLSFNLLIGFVVSLYSYKDIVLTSVDFLEAVTIIIIVQSLFLCIPDFISLGAIHFTVKRLKTATTGGIISYTLLLVIMLLTALFVLYALLVITQTIHGYLVTPEVDNIFSLRYPGIHCQAHTGIFRSIPRKEFHPPSECIIYNSLENNIFNGTFLFYLPAITPIVMVLLLFILSLFLRYTKGVLGPLISFVVERIQFSSSGIFTQLSSVIAALVAVLALFR